MIEALLFCFGLACCAGCFYTGVALGVRKAENAIKKPTQEALTRAEEGLKSLSETKEEYSIAIAAVRQAYQTYQHYNENPEQGSEPPPTLQ